MGFAQLCHSQPLVVTRIAKRSRKMAWLITKSTAFAEVN